MTTKLGVCSPVKENHNQINGKRTTEEAAFPNSTKEVASIPITSATEATETTTINDNDSNNENAFGDSNSAKGGGDDLAPQMAQNNQEERKNDQSSQFLKRKFEADDLDRIKSPGKLGRKRIRDAKHKARSELVTGDLFGEERYYYCFNTEKFKTNFISSVNQLPSNVTKEMLASRPYVIDRIDGRSLTELEFIEKFERPKIPVIFTHLMDDWPAYRQNDKWSSLAWLDRKFRNQKFKCGEDDSGYSVKLKMKYYLQYLRNTTDDSPLYVFDSNYGEHPKRKKLLNDYTVPHLFREDLFQHTGENKRPPYRWFVMGPARSGTGIHIDPLATSAWNSLIRGAKRWCLLPNEVPKHLVKTQPSDHCSKQKDEAITWFNYVYPRVTSPSWPAKWRPIEFVQLPGDTVFVPGGWWHVVLNLDISVAVTQNYCNSGNFKEVWQKTARGRPRFCHKWYRTLKKIGRDDLIAVAEETSRNHPEHIPNTELCLSSSDSSSDTSSESSDESSSAAEGIEAPMPATCEKLKSCSPRCSDATSSVSPPSALQRQPCTATNDETNLNSSSDSETSDDDSGMEEQDKKRRRVATTQ